MTNTFTELLACDNLNGLEPEQAKFVTTHRRIIFCGTTAGQYLLEMARELKAMHDGKLYKSAGFENFESYVEEAAGIGYRQAKRYITCVEKYDEKFLIENSDVGVSKLALLAQVTEEEREKIFEVTDIHKATKADIENAVKEIKSERDAALKKLEAADGKVADLERERDEAEDSRAELQRIYDEKKQELIKAKETVKELETKLKNVKPIKETVAIDETSKKEAKEQRARADEYEKLVDEQKKQVDELEQQLKEVTAQLTVAKEQKKAIASDDLLEFKLKYIDLQRIGQDLMSLFKKMKPENAAKCKKALSTVIQEWAEDMAS